MGNVYSKEGQQPSNHVLGYLVGDIVGAYVGIRVGGMLQNLLQITLLSVVGMAAALVVAPFIPKPVKEEAPMVSAEMADNSRGTVETARGGMKTNRGLVKYLLLSLVTCGIYSIYAMWVVGNDINVIARKYDGKKTMNYCLIFFIFSTLTFGIASFVWFHRVSARIGRELGRRGINYRFGAGSFWGWNLLGSIIGIGQFVYMHKLFKALNLLSKDYNINF